MAMYSNAHGGKATPEDFMPDGKPKREMTRGEMWAAYLGK